MKRRPTKKTSPKTNTTHWVSKPPTWPPAKRVAPKQSIRRQFYPRPYNASQGIPLGALVCLVDANDKQQQIFLGPDGGSMKLLSGEAPLGKAMLGKCEGDEVSVQVAPLRLQFEVLRAH